MLFLGSLILKVSLTCFPERFNYVTPYPYEEKKIEDMSLEQISPLDKQTLRRKHSQIFGERKTWSSSLLDVLPEVAEKLDEIAKALSSPIKPSTFLPKNYKRKRQFKKLVSDLVAYLLDPDFEDSMSANIVAERARYLDFQDLAMGDIERVYTGVSDAVKLLGQSPQASQLQRYIGYKLQFLELGKIGVNRFNDVLRANREFHDAYSEHITNATKWDVVFANIAKAKDPQEASNVIRNRIHDILQSISSLIANLFFDAHPDAIDCNYMVPVKEKTEQIINACNGNADACSTFCLPASESPSGTNDSHLKYCDEILIIQETMVPKYNHFWVPVYKDSPRLLRGAPKAYLDGKPDVVFVADRFGWPSGSSVFGTVNRVFEYFKKQDFKTFLSLPARRQNEIVGVLNINAPNDTLRLYNSKTVLHLTGIVGPLLEELARLHDLRIKLLQGKEPELIGFKVELLSTTGKLQIPAPKEDTNG